MKKRKIAVFTGNRAEYGLQFPILKAIAEHPKLDYCLIVSGAHLDKNFGNTLIEIEKDGFNIHAEIKIDMDTNHHGTSQAIGSGILSISKILYELKPDIMVVYADRFEGFAAVIAASQMNIPTAHIEGGDITEGGALDDSVRHAMTKLSHIHFTTNSQASNRILSMGEESWRVHTVGFPAIDLLSQGNYASPIEIIKKLKLDLSKPIILFTQHSVTTEFNEASSQLKPSLLAIEDLSKDDLQVICTYPNNDAGGKSIIMDLKKFSKKKIKGLQLHQSLGRYIYHGVLALAIKRNHRVVCVGNSSSGIKETPFFGCPTVNIGSRQEGRLRGQNVIDTDYNRKEIKSAIEKCLYNENFRKKSEKTENPYYIGNTGIKIANKLASINLGKKILRKKMTIKGKEKNGWYQ